GGLWWLAGASPGRPTRPPPPPRGSPPAGPAPPRGRAPGARGPRAGLRLWDTGCGGGLLAEPMTRLGARVTGIDAVARNIAVARLHAERSGVAIDYRAATPEELTAGGAARPLVLPMEAVAHAAATSARLAASCA